MRFEVDRTRALFMRGRPLIELMPPDLRIDVDLFVRGGLAVLHKIEQCGYDVWARRPVVSKWDQTNSAGRRRMEAPRRGRELVVKEEP